LNEAGSLPTPSFRYAWLEASEVITRSLQPSPFRSVVDPLRPNCGTATLPAGAGAPEVGPLKSRSDPPPVPTSRSARPSPLTSARLPEAVFAGTEPEPLACATRSCQVTLVLLPIVVAVKPRRRQK
jgi:hypothetical protein